MLLVSVSAVACARSSGFGRDVASKVQKHTCDGSTSNEAILITGPEPFNRDRWHPHFSIWGGWQMHLPTQSQKYKDERAGGQGTVRTEVT